ncbi:MAG TPA: TetR/AcrR family transcriptional regulator [Streptosporangiaceae bacterium]|nr:TetR/AcrR family transcriptional regulator [Streptosporangiaceae bacterium]
MATTDMDTVNSPLRADARRNRARLLAAALAAFTERGSDDTSLEEIARRAGVGIGTLYRHFPTRQALLESVYRDQVDALCARGRDLLAEPSPAAGLSAWLRALVAFSLTKRSLTSELLAGTGSKNAPVFSGCRTEMIETAAALLARAQEAGQVRADIEPVDLLRISHAVVAATEHAADPGTEAYRLLEIMLGGVQAAENEPAP